MKTTLKENAATTCKDCKLDDDLCLECKTKTYKICYNCNQRIKPYHGRFHNNNCVKFKTFADYIFSLRKK